MEKPEAIVSSDTEFSVSSISALLKGVVETAFAKVKIRGEISGVKRASSGHIYFALKDEQAVIDAVSWRGQNGSFANFIKDGLEVVVTGRITTYPARSNYQIVVDGLVPAGEGALLKMLEERKKKLAAEGLFDAAKKKPIPFLPSVVGVVTSPTGAVIRDIIHRITDRYPLHIILWPVAVQGAGAAEEIACAIKGFNNIKAGGNIPRPDVLIVARGGGSIEDLLPFNEECVVRAAAASDIPLISAVGHETDTTLIDYAADLRAPTPTGAAELATPVRADLIRRVSLSQDRMFDAASRLLSEYQTKLVGLVRGLPDLSGITDLYAQRLDDKTERLNNIIKAYFNALSDKLSYVSGMLNVCSYEKVLKRGFALVFDEGKKPVTSAENAKVGSFWQVRFKDGEVPVVVGQSSPVAKKVRGQNKSEDTAQDKQGELLL